MAVVGDQFYDCVPSASTIGSGAFGSGGSGADSGNWRSGNGSENSGTGNEPEICGCTLSVRQSEDILSVWNRHGLDTKVNQKIKYVLHIFIYLFWRNYRLMSSKGYNKEGTGPAFEYCCRI